MFKRPGIIEGIARRVAITMATIKELKLKLCPPDILITLDRDNVGPWNIFDPSEEHIMDLLEQGNKATMNKREEIFSLLKRLG